MESRAKGHSNVQVLREFRYGMEQKERVICFCRSYPVPRVIAIIYTFISNSNFFFSFISP